MAALGIWLKKRGSGANDGTFAAVNEINHLGKVVCYLGERLV